MPEQTDNQTTNDRPLAAPPGSAPVAAAVPLSELLRAVPEDARDWFPDVIGMRHIPYGRYCHQAAAALDALKASAIPCQVCSEPVVEFSAPNRLWNAVVRKGGPEHEREYLCLGCFLQMVAQHVAEQNIESQ